MWKDYWYVVIPVHVVTSIGWYVLGLALIANGQSKRATLGRIAGFYKSIIIQTTFFYISRYGGFYLLIKSGVDIPATLEWMGTSEVGI